MIGCTQITDIITNRESNSTISGRSKIPLRIMDIANAGLGLFTAWKNEFIVIAIAYRGIKIQSLRINCVAYCTVSASRINKCATGAAKISRSMTTTAVAIKDSAHVVYNSFRAFYFSFAP